MFPDPRFVTSADGTRLSVYDFDPTAQSKPDLLLGHATSLCSEVWQPVLPTLTTHFRVVAVDSRGHGASDDPPPSSPEPWNWDRFSEDLDAVITACELTHPIGVGHSASGAGMLQLAGANPELFDALVLFEPVVFTPNHPAISSSRTELIVRALRRQTDFPDHASVEDRFRERGPFVDLHDAALHGYLRGGFRTEADGSLRLRCHPEHEAQIYENAPEHQTFAALPHVTTPVQLVRGQHSMAFSAEHVAEIASALPRAVLHTLPHAGHFGPLEDPLGFLQLVFPALSDSAPPTAVPTELQSVTE